MNNESEKKSKRKNSKSFNMKVPFKATPKEIYNNPNAIKGFDTAPLMGFLKPIKIDRKQFRNRFKTFLPKIFSVARMIREIKKTIRSLKKNPTNPKTIVDDEFIKNFKEFAGKYNVILGFTKLKRELIFKNEAVFFEDVIVLSMEMNKEIMDKAPSLKTQHMIIDTYNKLGIVANKVAKFLRKNGYVAQACHPLGGAISYPPLAQLAGMGLNGRHGLAITPEFGPRHRLTAVLTNIENLPYSDNNDHKWIEDYCKTCGRCIRKCPVGAIYDKAIINEDESKTHINFDLCFSEFLNNYGCSVCVKECMFNRVGYFKLKSNFNNKNPS
jgi:ferredoxin